MKAATANNKQPTIKEECMKEKKHTETVNETKRNTIQYNKLHQTTYRKEKQQEEIEIQLETKKEKKNRYI